MDYLLVCLIGACGGAFVVFIALDSKRKRLDKQRADQEAQAERLRANSQAVTEKQIEIEQLSAKLAARNIGN